MTTMGKAVSENRRPMYDAFAEERQEDSRVLRMAYYGIKASGGETPLFVRPVNFTPAGDQQRHSEKGDRVPDDH